MLTSQEILVVLLFSATFLRRVCKTINKGLMDQSMLISRSSTSIICTNKGDIMNGKITMRILSLLTVLSIASLFGTHAHSETSDGWDLFHLFTTELAIDSWIQRSNESAPWIVERTEFNDTKLKCPEKYIGPQTVKALMKVFNEAYNHKHESTTVQIFRKANKTKTNSEVNQFTITEIDARYPREVWFQMLLDKGITIENFGEYASYLSKRYTLGFLKDNPNLRNTGILGIPPTNEWGTYKTAFIDMLVSHHPQIRKATEQVEQAKAQVERAKVLAEQGKEQAERAKAQVERAKEQIERAKNKFNSQQLENVRKQIEHLRETLERLKESMPPQNPKQRMQKKPRTIQI